MTAPATFKFSGDFELQVPEGFTAEVTIKLIPIPPAEPEQPLPPNPAKALRAAA
jgi:hypothetical protein